MLRHYLAVYMIQAVASFFSLYAATIVLLLGTGLFNTYLSLRLSAESVSEVWIGALIAVYYLGLVFGARFAHRLISHVGHIRAYATSAAIVTATVLAQALNDNLWLWLLYRFIVGFAIVTQFMVIESWLNEQTENHQRGFVFALYMTFSGLGTVLGQVALTFFPKLDYEPLIFSAICSVLCLVPVALTRRVHPALQTPAPLMVRYYLMRVPMSLLVVTIAGILTGAFYGLGPVFAVSQGISADQAAMFMAVGVGAGLLAQGPMGWLADRFSRVTLLRLMALLLALAGIPLWGWLALPYWSLMLAAAVFGALQFPLYPIGVAFANDNIEPERRVGLSGILLMAYGLGAFIGPIAIGWLMRQMGSDVFFMFVSACVATLVVFVRHEKVTGEHLTDDAPTQFVPMTELPATSVSAPLDPRVDVEADISHEAHDEPSETEAA